MRTVTEYLLKAAEFDDLAQLVPNSALRKRYADLAECYRLLARERERLVTTGTLADTSPAK